MRIWLRIPDELLRRALGDLLAGAGHDVSIAVAPAPRADLHVVAGSAWESVKLPAGSSVLVLGGPEGEAASTHPLDSRSASLAAALARGGTACWPSPLDPAALLAVLASKGTTALPRPAEEPEPDAALAAAHDPWLLLDPTRREVLWANFAATTQLEIVAGDLSEAIRRPPLAAVADAVLSRKEGRRRCDHLGRPCLAVWWTDARGRRILGLLEVPLPVHEDPQGNLRTLAEIGRLSTTLAHEIRNPLAALAGALDLLAHESEPGERAEILALAHQRLAQMKTLLDDTLRLARPFKSSPAPLDPAAVIRSALQGVRTDPLFRQVELSAELGTEPVTAVGHEEPLRQAITNLLLNAAQAQGGRGSITVRLTQEDAWAVVRVLDEGPGIPVDQRTKVFEPFWTTRSSGTGLGLSYVRRVADACGGRARVEDSVRGACLRLDLPLAS